MPARINGFKVTAVPLENGRPGFRVPCCNDDPRAEGCKKQTAQNTYPELGPRGAWYFLKCWHSKAAGMDCARHRKYRPSLAEVREFVDLGGW